LGPAGASVGAGTAGPCATMPSHPGCPSRRPCGEREPDPSSAPRVQWVSEPISPKPAPEDTHDSHRSSLTGISPHGASRTGLRDARYRPRSCSSSPPAGAGARCMRPRVTSSASRRSHPDGLAPSAEASIDRGECHCPSRPTERPPLRGQARHPRCPPRGGRLRPAHGRARGELVAAGSASWSGLRRRRDPGRSVSNSRPRWTYTTSVSRGQGRSLNTHQPDVRGPGDGLPTWRVGPAVFCPC
jgi:hypothetical protein